LSKLEKIIEKLYRKPIPNDITFLEVEKVAEHYGCIVLKSGGRHPIKVIHKETGTVIPIPKHSKHVQEVYIKQLKDLFNKIK